ncbi:MAG: hypothetical protein LBJ71_02725 [Holosporaceae bacterium]|nr:hypothetical protein [Holosporaceae bacterium]
MSKSKIILIAVCTLSVGITSMNVVGMKGTQDYAEAEAKVEEDIGKKLETIVGISDKAKERLPKLIAYVKTGNNAPNEISSCILANIDATIDPTDTFLAKIKKNTVRINNLAADTNGVIKRADIGTGILIDIGIPQLKGRVVLSCAHCFLKAGNAIGVTNGEFTCSDSGATGVSVGDKVYLSISNTRR